MSTTVIVAGEIATVRVRLEETGPYLDHPGPGFPEILGRDPGSGRPDRSEPEPFFARDPEELRLALENEIEEIVRKALGATAGASDVQAKVRWRAGSLDVSVVLEVAKLVIEIGAFLGALREIRRLVPAALRARVAEWVGRPVAADVERLEVGEGLLEMTVKPPADAVVAADDPAGGSIGELAGYGLSALAVLLVVATAVIAGAHWIT